MPRTRAPDEGRPRLGAALPDAPGRGSPPVPGASLSLGKTSETRFNELHQRVGILVPTEGVRERPPFLADDLVRGVVAWHAAVRKRDSALHVEQRPLPVLDDEENRGAAGRAPLWQPDLLDPDERLTRPARRGGYVAVALLELLKCFGEGIISHAKT